MVRKWDLVSGSRGVRLKVWPLRTPDEGLSPPTRLERGRGHCIDRMRGRLAQNQGYRTLFSVVEGRRSLLVATTLRLRLRGTATLVLR